MSELIRRDPIDRYAIFRNIAKTSSDNVGIEKTVREKVILYKSSEHKC